MICSTGRVSGRRRSTDGSIMRWAPRRRATCFPETNLPAPKLGGDAVVVAARTPDIDVLRDAV
jgi:hypothetical protein